MSDEARELAMLEAEDTPKTQSKRITITVDNRTEDVVRLDSEGHDLFFEDTPGRFLDIPDEVLKSLSALTQTRYLVSYRSYTKLKEREAHPEHFPTPGIEVSPRLASATSRIEVLGKDPNKDYCWKRSDELQQSSREGWKVSSDPNLQTFGGEVGSSRQIAAGGQTEMVLMEAPKGTSIALQRAAAEKSRKRSEGVEKSTAEDMKRAGGLPFVPKAGDKNFT